MESTPQLAKHKVDQKTCHYVCWCVRSVPFAKVGLSLSTSTLYILCCILAWLVHLSFENLLFIRTLYNIHLFVSVAILIKCSSQLWSNLVTVYYYDNYNILLV